MTYNFISCVLDIPPIEPDDWNLWWQIWQSSSKFIEKETNFNGKDSGWRGLEIYRSHNYTYDCYSPSITFIDLQTVFPRMFKQIFQLPIKLNYVRALQSIRAFSPHKDTFGKNFISLRSIIYDENPNPTFYYIENKKIYQRLPKTSNTWIAYDSRCLHGTDFNKNYKKIMFYLWGEWEQDKGEELVKRSLELYKDFNVF